MLTGKPQKQYMRGIHEPKPIRNVPPGCRVRIRMRSDAWIFAIVYDPSTKRATAPAVYEEGETWALDFEIQMPTSKKTS